MDFGNVRTKENMLEELLEAWKAEAGTETVRLEESTGRVSASSYRSLNTLPLCRVSAMDGFAVKSSAFASGMPDVSKWKEGIDYISADTGDDFPDDYDTVIPVEKLDYGRDGVLVFAPGFSFQPASGIRESGSYVREGDLLIGEHTLITPEAASVLAMGGITEVEVYRKIRVSFIPTGSELIPPERRPGRGENVDSNSILAAAELTARGAGVSCHSIVRDEENELEAALDTALAESDIVILNGGSSKGREDYTHRLIERNASYYAHSVRTVPGRPVAAAVIDGKVVINIPGPSFACWVVLDWLIRPLIERWYGIPRMKRHLVDAVLEDDIRKGPPVELYQMVRIEKKGAFYMARPLGRNVKNADMFRLGNGLVILPAGSTGYRKGRTVKVELLTDEGFIPSFPDNPPDIPPFCSQCGNHCPTDALMCGKGKAHLRSLLDGEIFPDPLLSALTGSGKAALHMALSGADSSAVFSALDDGEKKELLLLLSKLDMRWQKEHEERIRNRMNKETNDNEWRLS